jgi:hypothetical protein
MGNNMSNVFKIADNKKEKFSSENLIPKVYKYGKDTVTTSGVGYVTHTIKHNLNKKPFYYVFVEFEPGKIYHCFFPWYQASGVGTAYAYVTDEDLVVVINLSESRNISIYYYIFLN